jgi:glycosyltransferase involved in cell wall biosynthesis
MDLYIDSRYRPKADAKVAIPVGVNAKDVQRLGDPPQLRELYGLNGRRVILSLGHVIPLRDRLTLVEALPAVVQRYPDVQVLIVGDVHYPRFLERAEELGVRAHITCAGAVPKSRIADHLAIADVETHDLQGYGLGTASLEAMAAGVPVVAAVRRDNFPGVELTSNETIVLVPPGDGAALASALCALLDDPEKAKRIGIAGQALVEEAFSLQAVASAYLDVLSSLAN